MASFLFAALGDVHVKIAQTRRSMTSFSSSLHTCVCTLGASWSNQACTVTCREHVAVKAC